MTSATSTRSGPATILEWTARIRCNQYEVGGSFSVFIFLDEVPTNPKQWFTDSAFVGTFDAFVNSPLEGYANRNDQADFDIQGFVHLNPKFLKLSGQKSLEPSVVVPYLKKNLHWGVQKVTGTVAELPSLEVVVLATPLTLPEGAKYPTAGEPVHYHDITYGRPGGSRNP